MGLRNDLLENYDRGSFPWEHVWNESKSSAAYINSGVVKGLNVEMGLNFHKILEVDIMKSVIDVVVWVRFQWKDPRLAWNALEYANITATLRTWLFAYANPFECCGVCQFLAACQLWRTHGSCDYGSIGRSSLRFGYWNIVAYVKGSYVDC